MALTRAALLPTPGDPFLLKFWFHLFETRWQNEVDKLYVCYNSKMEKEVVEFVRKFMTKNPKVEFIYFDHMIDHGKAIKELLSICKEDLVLLIEDDGMIFREGAVKEAFDRIESGEADIVGSHRQSSTYGIAEATKNKFDHYDHEVFLWPNFLFTKKEYLLETDLNFGAKGFQKGEYIDLLDWTTESEEAMDTFGWATIQLRNMGLSIYYVDQYHAMAEDLIFFRDKIRAWKGDAPWCHLGSLSSMMTNFLFDSKGYPLESRTVAQTPIDPYKIPRPQNIEDHGPKEDMESRVANVLLAWERTQAECNDIDDFRKEYRDSITRLIDSFDLRDSLIRKKIEAYKILYTMHV